MSRLLASGILIGIGIGTYIPSLPGPLSVINVYFGTILIIVGILLLISAK
jgi:hypothetical protein